MDKLPWGYWVTVSTLLIAYGVVSAVAIVYNSPEAQKVLNMWEYIIPALLGVLLIGGGTHWYLTTKHKK